MINAVLRLEFEHVFPDEERKDVIEYLKLISSFSLLNIIGFSNTTPHPNFDNFFSSSIVHQEIVERVIIHCRANHLGEKPRVVSREGSLRLTEIILANRKELIEGNDKNDRDRDELNIFKAFLVINKELNSKQKPINSEDNLERLVDMTIAMTFSTGDLGIFENTDLEFGKLLYSTIVKFEILQAFIQSKEEYKYLENDLFQNFAQRNSKELAEQIKYLFGKLLQLKVENGFKFQVSEKESLAFLNSLVAVEINEVDDFTNLKNHPLYKLDEDVFSIIDFFFVVDKFFKSVKFILKDSFNKHHGLKETDRRFFEFYNTKFSEDFLMKKILDKIFNKSYLTKKTSIQSQDKEPDYYVRHNKRIYLFENKDVLVSGKVRSSGDISQIDQVLKSKFLEVDKKPIGIGQLVNSIVQIVENNFPYDAYVNKHNNFTIYPILLVHDRIFEILGVNYKLNQWYLELVKKRLGDRYNPNFIKDLTMIDIDTLIYWSPHLEKNDSNFREIIDDHLKCMSANKKVNQQDLQLAKIIANKNLTRKISPISSRLIHYKFPVDALLEKFKDVLKN